MRKRIVVVALLLAVVAVAAALFLRGRDRTPPTPQLTFGPAEGVAHTLADTASELYDEGSLLIVTLDPQVHPSHDRQVAILRERRHGKAARARVVTVNLSREELGETFPSIPADLFARIVRGHTDAGVVVSLIGPPAPGARALMPDPAHPPAVLVAQAAPDEADALLEEGLVRAVVVPRTDVSVSTPPKSPEEAFSAYYELRRR